MPLIFLCGFVAIALWSLVEHRFERYGVAGPAALTLAGAVLVFIDVDGFAEAAAGDRPRRGRPRAATAAVR